MKLYWDAVYNLKMCIKDDNLGQNGFKGDNFVIWIVQALIVGNYSKIILS